MNTYSEYYLLLALFNVRNFTKATNDCKYLPGLYRIADRLKLQGITDEELLQLPKCLQDKARVFIISVRESNFTLSAFVKALPERVKQNVVDFLMRKNGCRLQRMKSDCFGRKKIKGRGQRDLTLVSLKMIVNCQYYIPQSGDNSSELTSSANTTQNASADFTSQQKQTFDQIQFSEKKRNGLLRVGKRLGRGAFGDVFEGLVADSKSGTWKKVAIKKIRDNSASNDSENLMSEYQHMTDIGRHPNIIQVYGIGKLEDSLIMVMELAHNGDTLAHLKEIERLNQRSIRNLDSAEERFYLQNKHPRLFLYMWHVAKGMEYLSQLKIVHRDIAARNVLLTAGHVAKLSDFGLSRDVYENSYYFQSLQGRLPYKWMSPETLFNGKFTSSSDVWSFGVFLWEIVTLGSSPYPGIPPDMLINMYKSKYIMPQPPLCPDSVYSIMKNCWRHTPEERTNFTSLVDQLDMLVQTVSEKDYMEITSGFAEDQVSLVEAEMSPDRENCLPEVTHIPYRK